jgi:hypothetical protein
MMNNARSIVTSHYPRENLGRSLKGNSTGHAALIDDVKIARTVGRMWQETG